MTFFLVTFNRVAMYNVDFLKVARSLARSLARFSLNGLIEWTRSLALRARLLELRARLLELYRASKQGARSRFALSELDL